MDFNKKFASVIIKEFESCIDLTIGYFNHKEHSIHEKELFFYGAFLGGLGRLCSYDFFDAIEEKIVNNDLEQN